jgi:hypothetical protein
MPARTELRAKNLLTENPCQPWVLSTLKTLLQKLAPDFGSF